jgi:hypothetical protein
MNIPNLAFLHHAMRASCCSGVSGSRRAGVGEGDAAATALEVPSAFRNEREAAAIRQPKRINVVLVVFTGELVLFGEKG